MHVHTFADDRLPVFLANGVTGIRHMGAAPVHAQWRDQLAAGSLLAPRMVVASRIIDGPQPLRPYSIAVTDEADARQAVHDSMQGGADFLKVYNLLPRAAYFALADEARRHGLPFVGLVPFSVSVAETAAAGRASIEHLEGVFFAASTRRDELTAEVARIDPTDLAAIHSVFADLLPQAAASYDPDLAAELYRSFVAHRTWHIPTLAVLQASSHLGSAHFPLRPYLSYIEPDLRQMWESAQGWVQTAEQQVRNEELFDRQLRAVADMHRAGVALMAGTDTFVPGFSLHDELALLVRAGLTRMEALQAATYHPARYLGVPDAFGTVAEGKVADLVVLDANPLNIRNTRTIRALLLGGRYLDRADLDRMLTPAQNDTTQNGPAQKDPTQKDPADGAN